MVTELETYPDCIPLLPGFLFPLLTSTLPGPAPQKLWPYGAIQIYYYFFWPRYSIPREEKLCYAKTKYENKLEWSLLLLLLLHNHYYYYYYYKSSGLSIKLPWHSSTCQKQHNGRSRDSVSSTCTTYPDMYLKLRGCLWTSTSTSPDMCLPVFLPARISSRLKHSSAQSSILITT